MSRRLGGAAMAAVAEREAAVKRFGSTQRNCVLLHPPCFAGRICFAGLGQGGRKGDNIGAEGRRYIFAGGAKDSTEDRLFPTAFPLCCFTPIGKNRGRSSLAESGGLAARVPGEK